MKIKQGLCRVASMRLFCEMFSFIWRKHLRNEWASEWNKKPVYNKVFKVKGWRTAIVDLYGGQRETQTYLIKIWKFYL